MSQFPSTTTLNKIFARSCTEDFLQVGAISAPQPGQNNPQINSWIDSSGALSGGFVNPNPGKIYNGSALNQTGNVAPTVLIPAQSEDATYQILANTFISNAGSVGATWTVSPLISYVDPDVGATTAVQNHLTSSFSGVVTLFNQPNIIAVKAGTEVTFSTVNTAMTNGSAYNIYVSAIRIGSPTGFETSSGATVEASYVWNQEDISEDFLQIVEAGSGDIIGWIDSTGTPSGSLAPATPPLPAVYMQSVLGTSNEIAATQIVPAQAGATLWAVFMMITTDPNNFGQRGFLIDANNTFPAAFNGPIMFGPDRYDTSCFLVPLPANDALNFYTTITVPPSGPYSIYVIAQRLV